MDYTLTLEVGLAETDATRRMDWADGLAAWLWAAGAHEVVVGLDAVTAQFDWFSKDHAWQTIEALKMDPRSAGVRAQFPDTDELAAV